MLRKASIFILFFISAHTSYGQVLDTTVYSRELSKYITEDMLNNLELELEKEDTSFSKNYLIHPLRKSNTFFLDLGPTGSPSFLFEGRFNPITDFDLGMHVIDAYQSEPDKIKYYFSNTPRTLLKYSQGSRDLIYLKAEHSQKISELWSIGLDYQRIKSNNVYYANLTDFSTTKIPSSYKTQFYTRFHSPNKRYELLASWYWDKNDLVESGGLTSTERFDTLTGREKKFNNLSWNAQSRNILKHTGWHIKQYYRVGDYPEPIIEYDSINTDSIVKVEVKEGTASGQFYHSFDYRKVHWGFTDPNPNLDFYPELLQSKTSNDSLVHYMFKNQIGFTKKSLIGFKIDLGMSHAFHSINQNELMRIKFHELSSNVKIGKEIGIIKLNLESKRHFTGFNKNDRHDKLKVKLKQFELQVLSSKYQPNYASNYYFSNHFYWFQRRDKIDLQQVNIKYEIGDFLSLAFTQSNLKNWIIYDENATPFQIKDQISASQLSIQNHLKFFNWHLRTNIESNIISDDRLPAPKWAFKESLYYEGLFFKKSMLTQIGFDFYYQASFEGMTYNPAIRQFHLSPGNSIGNYPLLDVFFSAKVGGFKMFGIIEHANESVFGDSYYSAANYPINPFSFRFGLEWRLFD